MSSNPNYKAELVGVFGHPVAENPTVVMQEAGFQALQLNWRYLTIEVLPQDLQDAKVDPKGKKVLVLGAGGAARSITVELALAGAQKITIVNRSAERGKVLTELINTKTPAKASFIAWNGTYSIPEDTDILVNATSIGLAPLSCEKPDVDYGSILPGMLVCDVIPAPMTPFLKEAQKRGAKTLDGLGMLVYQGAIGFKLWTGLEAPVEAMYRALSKAFNIE